MASLQPVSPALDTMRSGFAITDPHHPVTSILGPMRLSKMELEEINRYEDHYQYPQAFNNKVFYLGKIITGLLSRGRQDQNYLVREILPVKLTDSMRIEWNRMHFAEGTALIGPEESVPHVLKFTQSSDFRTVERRHIAIRGEANYLYTQEGQQLLNMQIVQVYKACEESQCIDTIFSLMMTDKGDFGRLYSRGIITRDWQRMISKKNAETFCLQKRHNAFDQNMFDLMVDERKEVISDAGGSASHLIMCRGAEIYVRGFGQDLSYSFAGPAGPAKAQQNAFAPLTSFRGLQVRYLKQYVLQRGMAPSDFLTGPKIGAEYYLIKPADVDRYIYDYTAGKFKPITYIEARANAIEIADSITPDPARALDADELAALLPLRVAARNQAEERARLEGKSQVEITRAGTNAYNSVNTAPLTFTDGVAVNAGTDLVMICRLFMQFLVGNAIMVHAGADLGHNFVGTNSNSEWGNNAADQTKLATYNFYSKAVIFEPAFVSHLKEILCKRYIGGGNAKAMSKDELVQARDSGWAPQLTPNSNSWFALIVKPSEGLDIPKHIALSGRFDDDDNSFDNNSSHFITIAGVREKYNWTLPVSRSETQVFYSPNLVSNTNNGYVSNLILSEGFSFVKVAGDKLECTLGDSFLGHNIYQGCERVLNGIDLSFKDMEYEKAAHTMQVSRVL